MTHDDPATGPSIGTAGGAAGAEGRGTAAPAAAGASRFVVFSMIDGEPWEAGSSAAALLDRVRSLSALGIGLTRSTEILDCGAEADEVLGRGMPLDEARRRFRTAFRGEDVGPGLPSIALTREADAPPPSAEAR